MINDNTINPHPIIRCPPDVIASFGIAACVALPAFNKIVAAILGFPEFKQNNIQFPGGANAGSVGIRT